MLGYTWLKSRGVVPGTSEEGNSTGDCGTAGDSCTTISISGTSCHIGGTGSNASCLSSLIESIWLGELY